MSVVNPDPVGACPSNSFGTPSRGTVHNDVGGSKLISRFLRSSSAPPCDAELSVARDGGYYIGTAVPHPYATVDGVTEIDVSVHVDGDALGAKDCFER
jgi:hypothetical protein